MIHRRAAEIAEKAEGNRMRELRNVRDTLLHDFECKLLFRLNSLRPPRLRGE
jgi:hypothetical protein